ncbi:MAG: hypothetical protein ACK5LT_06755 [Lachnospirales bacterium]
MDFNLDCELLLDVISKKEVVLLYVSNICENQHTILKQGLSQDNKKLFYEMGNAKQEYIDKIQKYDIVFERVFARVAQYLEKEKEKADIKELIRKIQFKISKVTNYDTAIRAWEKENTKLIENIYKTKSEAKSPFIQVNNMPNIKF